MTYEIKLQVGSPHVLLDHLRKAAECYFPGTNTRNTLDDALAQIKQQVNPPVDEPEEFASVVRAGIDGLSDRVLWQRSASSYWFSETSRRATFADLHHPEVLRVGIGDDPRPAQDDAYLCGRRDFADRVRRDLVQLKSSAITAPEERCYDSALATVAALLGES
jgi:hypothetical protein